MVDLTDEAAGRTIAEVIARRPAIAGFQETGRSRREVLGRFGQVVVFPRLAQVWRKPPTVGNIFVYPLGGQPVMVDAAKLVLVSVRQVQLSQRRPGVRPTYGTELVATRRRDGETVAVLNVHPVAHLERPENKAAHVEAIDNVVDWADDWDRYRRYVLGDFNQQHVEIPDLVSCWDGRRDQATGPGGGTPDHIFGPNGFEDVEVINTDSDHHAVVADEKEHR